MVFWRSKGLTRLYWIAFFPLVQLPLTVVFFCYFIHLVKKAEEWPLYLIIGFLVSFVVFTWWLIQMYAEGTAKVVFSEDGVRLKGLFQKRHNIKWSECVTTGVYCGGGMTTLYGISYMVFFATEPGDTSDRTKAWSFGYAQKKAKKPIVNFEYSEKNMAALEAYAPSYLVQEVKTRLEMLQKEDEEWRNKKKKKAPQKKPCPPSSKTDH